MLRLRRSPKRQQRSLLKFLTASGYGIARFECLKCRADLWLVRPCIMPSAPPVLVFMVLRRATVGACQVQRVLQLSGRPQDVQGVIAELL